MKNLNIYLTLEDGGQLPLNFSNGRELIHGMVSNDFGPPPRSLCFEAFEKDKKKAIRITVPYDNRDEVFLKIMDIDNFDTQ